MDNSFIDSAILTWSPINSKQPVHTQTHKHNIMLRCVYDVYVTTYPLNRRVGIGPVNTFSVKGIHLFLLQLYASVWPAMEP